MVQIYFLNKNRTILSNKMIKTIKAHLWKMMNTIKAEFKGERLILTNSLESKSLNF